MVRVVMEKSIMRSAAPGVGAAMGLVPSHVIAAARGDDPLRFQGVGICCSAEIIVAAEVFDSARARRRNLWPAYRSHRSSHLERRFSACRLMANVLASRQSTSAIHIWSTQRSNVSRTIGAVDPALASLRCGSQTVRGNQYSFGPRVRAVAALGRPGSHKGLAGRCICPAAA